MSITDVPQHEQATGAAAATDLLRVEDLSVEIGKGADAKPILRGISLSVRRGEILGVVGRTGSGKSMTLRAVLGTLPPGGRITGGSIHVDGQSVVGLSDRRMRQLRGGKMGLVPQQPLNSLNPIIPIERQFRAILRAHGRVSNAEVHERAVEMLRRVGMHDPERVLNSRVFELSGGMAQRVVIAMILCLRTPLVLADEPTTALDVTIQREILELLRRLCMEENQGMLMVTHDLGVVAHYCDRIAVFHEGRMVETGPTADVLLEPSHEYTRKLVESSASPSSLAEIEAALEQQK